VAAADRADAMIAAGYSSIHMIAHADLTIANLMDLEFLLGNARRWHHTGVT
jgi:hypothetical protein